MSYSNNQMPLKSLRHCLDTQQQKAMIGEDNSVCHARAIEKLCSLGEQGSKLALIINLLRDQGMRFGEVMGLQSNSYIFEKTASGNVIKGRLKFRGKGNKLRIIELSSFNLSLLSRYEQTSIFPTCGYLFQNATGGKIYYKFIQRRLSALFGNKFCSHDFRRKFAKRHSERGIPISAISRILGHSNLTNTMIYDHRGFERLDLDFKNPRPELIDTFPLGRLKSGDFFHPTELEEIEKVIKRKKAKAIFNLIAYGGLRSSEIPKLKKCHFYKQKKALSIGRRVIPLHLNVAASLADFCKQMRPNELIFKRVTQNSIKALFNRVSLNANRQVNARLLRASFIVSELDRGIDPVSLSFIICTSYENVGRYIPLATSARAAALKYTSASELNL